jgi:Ion channel
MRQMSDQEDIARGKLRLFDDASPALDRFGRLLVVTCLALLTLSLVDLRQPDTISSELGIGLVTIFVGATLVLAMRASGVSRRYRRLAEILVGIGFVATTAVIVVDTVSDTAAAGIESPPLIWLVLGTLAPVAVVRRLVHHRRASARTLLGAVSAYLLIALAFSFAFLAVDSYQSTPFFGTDQPSTSFMYFSLTTITTLGYGDLAAVEPFGRMLATVEAVVGQVYLVTFVAMIVGLIVGQRQSRTSSQ